MVSIDPVIGGLPTVGMTSSFTLGAKGAVLYADGALGRPTKLGDYPLIGTSTAFSRLQSGQSLLGRGGPMLGAPAPATGGRPTLAVTGAHLALVRVFSGDLVGYLEPAYVFETARAGDTPAVPAVVDRLLHLDPIGGPRPLPPVGGAVPKPMPMPAPAPGGAASGGSVTGETEPASSPVATSGG
jgi:hypothetical protein